MSLLLLTIMILQGCSESLPYTYSIVNNYSQINQRKEISPTKNVEAVDFDVEGGFQDFHVINKNDIWAIGHEGDSGGPHLEVALRSTDEGKTWKRKLVYTKGHFLGIFFLNSKIGWIVGSEGIVFKTVDAGEHWVQQIPPTKSTLAKVLFLNQQKGWIMADDGEFLLTNNGGTNWQSRKIESIGWVKNEFHGWLTSFSFADENNGWIVGESGHIYQTNNGGITWQSHSLDFIKLLREQETQYVNFRKVKFISSREGFIIVQVSKDQDDIRNLIVLLKTEDAGKSWKVISEFENRWFLRAQFLLENEIWIQTLEGKYLLHTTNGGKIWSMIPFPSEVAFPLICFVDSSRVLLFSDPNMFTSDGGKSWIKSRLKYIK